MRQPKPTPPYRQGELDSLCGLYALVNAVKHLCGPLDKHTAGRLFEQIVRCLEQRASLEQRIIWGTDLSEIGTVLGQVIDPQYPIRRCKGFHGRSRVTVDQFWERLRQFFDEHGGIVLTAVGGEHEHWTLVDRVTVRVLHLYDSDGLRQLHRRCCTTNPDNAERQRHILYPSHTYLLWVDNP